MEVTSRRRFLEVIALGSIGTAAGIGCGGGSAEPEAVGDVSAGNVSDLPVDTLRAIDGKPVAIGRDSGGVYALTLTCTHQGCNMAQDGSVSADAIYCSCHGSKFDRNGGVVNGPANSPLVHFAVEIDAAGALLIRGGQRVSAGARTPVV